MPRDEQGPRRRVVIVPHTHWDREWYSAFQTFRLRLVDLLDEFLPALDRDPSYAHFQLDGQMAVIDDYLAVRPDAEPTLKRLAAQGRLAVGPWYILMDEFLVSGETIVRSLQLGMDRATEYGGAMPVGYLPDMFGHVAQMPQILRLAGLDHAVVWRGVPSAIDRNAFWWTAPDGSTVRAEYLPHGYGNGASIPDDAKALVRRLAAYEEELGPFLLGDILFMNGTDHEVPQSWLGRVVAEANDLQDDFEFVVTSLADYLGGAPTDGLPSWTGELRSGARANLLMGVASNRVDVKQAAARAERTLERLAEPLCALFMPAERWPEALLDAAWMEVVRNSAHDSSCACSIDEVVDSVLHRYAEARQIADGLTTRALKALAGDLAEPGTVVVNPAARTRSGMVELEIEGEDVPEGTQVVRTVRSPFPTGAMSMKGEEVMSIVGEIRSQQIGESTYINSIDIDEDDDGISIVVRADNRLRDNLLVDEVKADIRARIAARPDVTVTVRMDQPVRQRVIARVDDVPGLGWKTWRPAPLDVAPATASADGATLGNGLVDVVIDPADGSFSLNGRPGFDRLVDSGDQGDTYNYSPPDNDTIVDAPDAVEIVPLESGPVRAYTAVKRTYTWPERIDDSSRSRVGSRTAEIVTFIEVRAGEPLVRVHAMYTNPSRDHRLRAMFPLGAVADRSRAECAFAVVERGLEAEGGPHERGLPTYPCRRFVQAGDVTVVHEGLLEYELIDGGSTLALTLLRATGMLSRVDMAYRPLPAGPPIHMEGPQVLKALEARYAVAVGDVDQYVLADDAFLPLLTVEADGGGTRPADGSAFTVDGAQLSALRRHPGGLEARVFNPTAAETTVSLDGRSGWLVDLRGRPLEPFDGSFTLGPHGIATARLAD
ncbi:MAG TPA: hypothetical protein VFA83_13750 [Acidimicrobiales bacterium]|nr:hypothetical protein [Acidimicrobiales bacterium]